MHLKLFNEMRRKSEKTEKYWYDYFSLLDLVEFVTNYYHVNKFFYYHD